MSRPIRFVLLGLAGLAGCAVVVIGALTALAVAVGMATLGGLRAATPRSARKPVGVPRVPAVGATVRRYAG